MFEQDPNLRDFLELINGMLVANPNVRLTMNEIKENKWMKGAVVGDEELKTSLAKIFSA